MGGSLVKLNRRRSRPPPVEFIKYAMRRKSVFQIAYKWLLHVYIRLGARFRKEKPATRLSNQLFLWFHLWAFTYSLKAEIFEAGNYFTSLILFRQARMIKLLINQ